MTRTRVHGVNRSADGVLALIGWLGRRPEEFIGGSSIEGELLPPAREGMIRVDMSRLADI